MDNNGNTFYPKVWGEGELENKECVLTQGYVYDYARQHCFVVVCKCKNVVKLFLIV